MGRNKLEEPGLVAYVVDQIEEKFENKQVGKTVIQKMMYFLDYEDRKNFNYKMYHYGPFSREVAANLDKAEKNDLLDINWVKDEGYYISTSDRDISFEEMISESEREFIKRIIEEYGEYNAQELSIIATAFHVKKEHDDIRDEKLIELVHSLKQKHDEDRIKFLLESVDLI